MLLIFPMLVMDGMPILRPVGEEGRLNSALTRTGSTKGGKDRDVEVCVVQVIATNQSWRRTEGISSAKSSTSPEMAFSGDVAVSIPF